MTYARRRSIRREEAETDEDEDELVVVENGKFRRRKEENEKKVQGEEDERQSDAKKEDEFGFVKNIKARRGNLQETDDEEEEALAARKGKARRGSQYKGDAQPVKNGITVATGKWVVDFKKENERDEKKAEEDEEDDDDEDEDENEEATPSKNPKSRRKDRDMAEEGKNDDIVASKHVHTRQGNDDDDESEDGDEGSDEEVTEDDDDENKVSVKAANPHSKKILENEDDREDANDEDTDADNSILADLPKDVVSPHLNKLQLPSNSSHLTPSAASGKSRQTRTPKETFSFTQASRPTKPNLSSGPTQQRTSYVSKQPVVETNQRTSHTPHSAKPNVEHVSEHTSNTSKPGKVDVEAAYPGQPGIPGALKSGNALTGIGATELRRKSELVKVDGASQRMLISRRLSGPVGDGDKERRLSEDRYPRGPMLGKGKGWPSSKKRRAGF
ncbi:hypothetical protein BC829DRAFT_410736 [Chytridium lagenaria]|nr:hypothetical protein BC829DRAFT_410736 [Chytridium lagenaria]